MHSSSGNIVPSTSCPANAGHPLSSCPANAGHLSSSLRAEGFGKTNLGSAQAPPRGPVRTARLPNPSATPACGSGVAISREVEKSSPSFHGPVRSRHSTAPSVPVIPRPVRGISPFPATRWTFLTSSGPEEDHAGVFPAPWSYIKHCPRRPDGSPRTRGLDNHRLFFNTADRSTVIFVVTVIIWQWICVQGRRTFQTLIGCTPNQRTLFYFV